MWTDTWRAGTLLLTADPGGPGGPNGPGAPSLPGGPARPYQKNEATEAEGDWGTLVFLCLPRLGAAEAGPRPSGQTGQVSSPAIGFRGRYVPTRCAQHPYPFSAGAWLTHFSSRALLTREPDNTRSSRGTRQTRVSLEQRRQREEWSQRDPCPGLAPERPLPPISRAPLPTTPTIGAGGSDLPSDLEDQLAQAGPGPQLLGHPVR